MENLDNKIRSIMFAFKVRGLEIFTDPNLKDRFLITRLVCSDCSAFFHTNLQECYLCGEINYYLLECNKCGTKRSITSSSRMCRDCYPDKKKKEPETLVNMCVNPACVSNTDKDIMTEINNLKNRGVFNRKNSWNISCTFCIKCGSPKHEYKYFRVFLYDEDEEEYETWLLKNKRLNHRDLIILKKHDKEDIKYDYEIFPTKTHNLKFDKIGKKGLDQIVEEILNLETISN